MNRPTKALLAFSLTAVLAAYLLFFVTPAGPRSLGVFEPQRTADLELRMWQAYYKKENARLFALLVTMLHEQNRYTWAKAMTAGFHLARAAAVFGNLKGDYEQVIPDLQHAYLIEKSWMNAGFDASAVADAELAWWVARRVPGKSDPENVGRLIAREYSLLYEVPIERVARAGLLRAEAGALRDRGGSSADWRAVGALLREAYEELHTGVQRQ